MQSPACINNLKGMMQYLPEQLTYTIKKLILIFLKSSLRANCIIQLRGSECTVTTDKLKCMDLWSKTHAPLNNILLVLIPIPYFSTN